MVPLRLAARGRLHDGPDPSGVELALDAADHGDPAADAADPFHGQGPVVPVDVPDV